MMLTADDVKNYITQGLPCDYIVVHGEDGQHFDAVIVSPLFSGKSMVRQHQLVYEALGEKMRTEIHAISLRTLTPEAWAESCNEMISED